MMNTSALLAALLALAFAAAPVAAATEEGSGDSAIIQAPLNPAPDDVELSTFVSAFVRLVGVQHGYMVMMQDEHDPSRLDDMKAQAVEDMTEAVEQDGMTVHRYNQIATALQTDSGLQGRVADILHELASRPDDNGDSAGSDDDSGE